MSDEFTEVVDRGVELLDRYSPYGDTWPYEVNLLELDMSDWRSCVLGQLYDGDYSSGVRELGHAAGWVNASFMTFGVRHGFEVKTGDGIHRTLTDYTALRDAWRNRIELLRAERGIPPTSA